MKKKEPVNFKEQYAKTTHPPTIWQPGNHPHVVAPRILSTRATYCQLRLCFFSPPKAVRQSFGCSMRVTMSTQIALGSSKVSPAFFGEESLKYCKPHRNLEVQITMNRRFPAWELYDNWLHKCLSFLPQSRLIVASSAWHFTFQTRQTNQVANHQTKKKGGPVKDLP